MPDVETAKKKTEVPWGGLITGLLVGGLFIGGGYIAYKIFDALTGGSQKRQALDEYQRELNALLDLNDSIASTGREPTETEQTIIDSITTQMKSKEYVIENSGWTSDLTSEVEHVLRDLGLWVIIPAVAGYIVICAWRFYNTHKRGGSGPTGPSLTLDNGVTVQGKDEMESEVDRSAQANTNTTAVADAQQLFNQLPLAVQDYIAAASGLYGKVKGDWTFLTPFDRVKLGKASYEAAMYSVGAAGAISSSLGIASRILVFAAV